MRREICGECGAPINDEGSCICTELLKRGWRRCAVGQKTTQWCAIAESVRGELREQRLVAAIEAAREDARVLRRGNERMSEALRGLEERERRDEALLRQALRALELRCGTNAEERTGLIPALRERLG